MNRLALLFSIFLINSVSGSSQPVKSPDEFPGYELGTNFTLHHMVTEYCRYAAGISAAAQYETYGTTCEGREMGVLIISSPENIASLEEIRNNNLIRAGLAVGECRDYP